MGRSRVVGLLWLFLGLSSVTSAQEAVSESEGRLVELSIPLSGVVHRVLVEAGQLVEQGEVLLKLDARRYQYRLNHAQAVIEEIQVELEDLELELNNQLELFERMVTTETELKRAKRRVAQARAQLAQRQALRDEAQLNLELTTLVAPINGVVAERYAEPGEVISEESPVPLLLLRVQ